MKFSDLLFCVLGALIAATLSHATSLSDYPHYSYDVRFTNPVCEEYQYAAPVQSVGGKMLTAKPKDVYCKPSDYDASAIRPDSVQSKIVEWVNDPKTKEMVMAYLSFSNKRVGEVLCNAIKTRKLKFTMILDVNTDRKAADTLATCGAKIEYRGHTPGIGYAHNKLIYINPKSKGKIGIGFSSGNLSSGVALHHENWHFITTDVSSHFAQAHLCLLEGVLNHGNSGAEYKDFIKTCRENISVPEEDDIKSYFVPGEGEAATAALQEEIDASKSISIAAHRFSYNKLIGALAEKLKQKKLTKIRLVTDDDTYWVGTTGIAVGPNMPNEFFQVRKLQKLGLKVKWMQTNHSAAQFHHNKFIVFDDRAVFAGAGNLTGDAFAKNFENFYMIRVPEIVQKFQAQYEHLYQDLATFEDDMPKENITP